MVDTSIFQAFLCRSWDSHLNSEINSQVAQDGLFYFVVCFPISHHSQAKQNKNMGTEIFWQTAFSARAISYLLPLLLKSLGTQLQYGLASAFLRTRAKASVTRMCEVPHQTICSYSLAVSLFSHSPQQAGLFPQSGKGTVQHHSKPKCGSGQTLKMMNVSGISQMFYDS